MNPVFSIANEQPVLPNTAQLSTAINLLRFTYLQRSLIGVESCLDPNFIGTRTFSVGPSETFNKVEYCVNKENGIWNGPPPRPTMMRAGPRVGTGTQTRVFCYEFDAKGGPLGKPVLYGMDEPKTCKSYINHTNSSTKMQSLEEEVNIYVIRKKDLSRVLVTDQNKDDLAMLYKEFVQLTDTQLIKKLAGTEKRIAQMEVAVNLAFFSFMQQSRRLVENTISPILEAPIDMTWSYGKEVSCQSLSRYLEVLDEEFFCHRVMAIVGMQNELGDRKQIKSCIRFLQASNVGNDYGPLNKSLLYLVEDNATAKKFAKAETQENLPKITELAHKINVYVIMQSSWTPMLITQDNKEEMAQSWKNYIGSDITQGDVNTLAFWLNTYFPS